MKKSFLAITLTLLSTQVFASMAALHQTLIFTKLSTDSTVLAGTASEQERGTPHPMVAMTIESASYFASLPVDKAMKCDVSALKQDFGHGPVWALYGVDLSTCTFLEK